LEPLLEFNLIERKDKTDFPGINEKDQIRTTALWRQFIRFATAT
jgi:hypothetical protein